MEWKFNDELPIYQQIMSQIKYVIASGEWKAGDKLSSVRELAVEAGVNPNTMQKALSELEREGLLYSKRTAGRFVSDKGKSSEYLQEEIIMECVKVFIEKMNKLGFSPEESVELLRKYVEKNEEE